MIPPEPGDDETRRDHDPHGQPPHSRRRPELDDASVDAAFADIVAQWRADAGTAAAGSSDGGSPAAAGSSDGGSPAAGSSDAGGPDAGSPQAVSPDAVSPDARVTGQGTGSGGSPGSGVDRAAIDEIFAARRRRIEREVEASVDGPGGGHFVPPPPAPLPRLDVFTLLAWAGALLGPMLIVAAAFTGGLIPRWIIAAAVAATIGGFVLLVSRLPRRSEADPEDDGAVV